MHIVVCIKQVPDSAQIRVHPVTNTIMRQGVPTIINPRSKQPSNCATSSVARSPC
jgi:electron transfer flavoprotein alpha/beta subunit